MGARRYENLNIFLLKKYHAKFISIFPTLKNLIFSFPICPLQHDINKM